jgi:hypothetical protein
VCVCVCMCVCMCMCVYVCVCVCVCVCMCVYFQAFHSGNTKGGSITVPLTSGLAGLESAE